MMIIAIDGPAGSGKGTIAGYLAQKFGLFHLDSGLIYRATAAKVLEEHVSPESHDAVIAIAQTITLEDTKAPNLRDELVANMASIIGAIPGVREVLTSLIQQIAQSITTPYKGIIVDGRDIGTVVLPKANHKLFITASEEIRMKRRQQQLPSHDHSSVKALISERDNRDTKRSSAPLVAAKDALILDTTHLSIHDTCQIADKFVKDQYFNHRVA